MTEAERKDRCDYAGFVIDLALKLIVPLNLPAAVWDLRNAKRRVEEAREKADG